ncbi:MAG: PTS lactose/cellobiose transporter subunit IIA [Erysipelotrichaceae bacterium]|nr:PTS lactose/cellobiose transporter subunit IIA [Erysipelotrichaceae bacterium]
MADNYEEVIMGLILNAGNAKSLAIEAYRKARSGQFDEADQLLKEADEAMTEAHHLQTSMIQDEINGHATPMTLLAVHAQDHTMTAMTVVDLVKEMVITIKEGK